TLLVAKLDETAEYDGRVYPLFTNRWADGNVEPHGWQHIERFHLEGTSPVWHFACADALIEKRVWMEPDASTTYVRYELLRGSGGVACPLDRGGAVTGWGAGLGAAAAARVRSPRALAQGRPDEGQGARLDPAPGPGRRSVRRGPAASGRSVLDVRHRRLSLV